MKRLLLMGLSAAALAGCAAPQYPVTLGYTPPPPITPKYPITPASDPRPAAQASTLAATQSDSAPAAARDSAAQTESPPAGSSAAPAPVAVESAPLAPLAASPPPASPPPASQPVQTPPAQPTQTPAASPPAYKPTPAYTPPPEAYAPPERTRKTEVRYVTDGKVVSARGMYRDYEVQKGDHLDAIARDLNTTREELISANHLRRPYRLLPGQHIKTPVAKAYVAVGGDTLPGVAKRFGVGLGELANLNDLPEHGRLTPGIYIGLPANYDDHGPSRETVTEEVYAKPRPRATYEASAAPAPSYQAPAYHAPSYQAARPAPSEPYAPGPYVPSAAALAAAQARREEASRPQRAYPTYESPRPAEAPANAAALATMAQGKFIWPVRGQVLSPFGASGMGRRNDGVDIGAPEGAQVQAVAVGEVVYAGDQVPGFGNLVLIKHAGGWVSAYAHLASVSVHMRETVYQGEQVGTVGETGGVTQPQLHFELRYAANPTEKARPLDPVLILPK